MGLVAAVWAHEGRAEVVAPGLELGAGEAFVTDDHGVCWDPVVVTGLGEQFYGDLTFAEFRVAGHQAIGMPSRAVIRYSFRPQYQRECEAQ